jgi:alkyl hydroperoxide reductase subunit AhpC
MLVEGKKENHDSYHTGQIQADNDPVEGIHKYSYAVLGDVRAEIASAKHVLHERPLACVRLVWITLAHRYYDL